MTESKTRIQTVDPEHEPEYVGAFAEPIRETCSAALGDYVEDLEPCDEPATHTVVMREPNGDLAEMPRCDDCGEPQDVEPSR